MDWNQITELPWFWEPFYSLPFTLIAILVIPTIFAYSIVVAMFKRRVGGAMFTFQVGFMSPSFVGIAPSIEIVIFCAVGGRLSIFGAIYGTLLVNWAKTTFSEPFPELWLFAMGALFIGVVLAFPTGLAGAYTNHIKPRIAQLYSKFSKTTPQSRNTASANQ
ncbi:MAG: urea transport system permease protein [Cellvibrionaceae bacterium]|jgi:urea transport system permease protein